MKASGHNHNLSPIHVPLGSLRDQVATVAVCGTTEKATTKVMARRINTTPTLALIAKDVEQFTTQIIHPFVTGVRV